jgi:hypothetical protein
VPNGERFKKIVTQETSTKAFYELKDSGRLNESYYWTLKGLERQIFPPTGGELFEFTKLHALPAASSPNDLRARLNELARKGCVEKCGKRRCTVTHKEVMTYRFISYSYSMNRKAKTPRPKSFPKGKLPELLKEIDNLFASGLSERYDMSLLKLYQETLRAKLYPPTPDVIKKSRPRLKLKVFKKEKA